MNTFTVEDRTRTSQNPQRRHSRRESCDEQFESELPPEIRAELEAPVRIPETEQEIQAAIAWLKSRGYLPTVSAPSSSGELSPPVSPPRPPVSKREIPAYRPVVPPPSARRSHGAAVIGCALIVALFIWALSHNNGPSDLTAPSESRPAATSSRQPAYAQAQPEVRRALPVDVRRALPVVQRAQLVSAPTTEIGVGAWHSVRLLDGTTTVSACFQGWLPSSADLPNAGHFIGEEFATGDAAHPNTWIWMIPVGASFPSWVDP